MISLARRAVRESLKALHPGDHIIVAVSGGADSLLLAYCVNLEAEKDAFQITSVIVNHQLQENSAEIAEVAKRELLKLGLDRVEIIPVKVMKENGLEADARTARYAALETYAKKIRATGIFLGHNQDDLAESVLLGLTQGAGTKSLAGMSVHDGKYLRPLLTLSREQILQACEEAGITYWSDPHNDDERFTRVKIRKNILPIMESEIGPGIRDALARSARIFREDSDALDQLTDEIYATIDNPYSIDILVLEKLPSAIRKRVIRRALASLGAARLSSEQIGWVEALISQWHGQGAVALPAGVTARRESGRLALSRE